MTDSLIHSRKYITQIRDFGNMRFGSITPTDIDALIEYKNICYVFIETKFENSELPLGQRLAIERLTDDLSRVKPTISIVASHSTTGDIDVANTTVTEFRFRGKWVTSETETTTFDLVDRFTKWAVMEHDTRKA